MLSPVPRADALTMFSRPEPSRAGGDVVDPAQLDNAVISEACVVHDPARLPERRPSGEHCPTPAGWITAWNLEQVGPASDEVGADLVVVALA